MSPSLPPPSFLACVLSIWPCFERDLLVCTLLFTYAPSPPRGLDWIMIFSVPMTVCRLSLVFVAPNDFLASRLCSMCSFLGRTSMSPPSVVSSSLLSAPSPLARWKQGRGGASEVKPLPAHRGDHDGWGHGSGGRTAGARTGSQHVHQALVRGH